jgi:PAS domain S-box-containing protein
MSAIHQGRSDRIRRPSNVGPATAVEWHRSPIARLTDPVLAVDATCQIVYVNPAFEELCGYDADELVGRSAQVLIPKGFKREHRNVRDRLVSDPGDRVNRSGEAVLLNKDGAEVPVERRLTTIETSTGPIILALVVDISERKGREQTVRERVADLERQLAKRTKEFEEQIEDHQAFANAASHDLQGPLRAMRGYAQALLDNHAGTMDPAAREFAAQIVDEATAMETLIGRLLAYNRVSQAPAETAPVNLLSVFHEALAYLAGSIREAGATMTITGGGLNVVAHEAMLAPVVINLVANAIKFHRPGEPPRLTLGARREGDNVRFWVEDEGIGIEPEDCERVFRIFERLDGSDQYPGNGVGLAIVKKAVERMRGQVGVESTLGKGSLFWVTLPAA